MRFTSLCAKKAIIADQSNKVLRNPVYFILLILLGVGAYVTYTLNLWGPLLRMSNAASSQGLEIFKEKLREFLETSETGRQAIGISAKHGDIK